MRQEWKGWFGASARRAIWNHERARSSGRPGAGGPSLCPAPAQVFVPRAPTAARPVSDQPATGSAFANDPPPEGEPGVCHDVSAAKGKMSETIPASPGLGLAIVRGPPPQVGLSKPPWSTLAARSMTVKRGAVTVSPRCPPGHPLLRAAHAGTREAFALEAPKSMRFPKAPFLTYVMRA